jgi:hypothetical protein
MNRSKNVIKFQPRPYRPSVVRDEPALVIILPVVRVERFWPLPATRRRHHRIAIKDGGAA